MKIKLLALAFICLSFPLFANQPEQATIDSLANEIGEIDSFQVNGDTATVVNLDGKKFTLVGENIGQLVKTLAEGYDRVKQADPEKPLDYLVALLPWLLGGGITSVIAYVTRAVNGLKSIFSGVEKDYKIVLGVAGVLALAWNIFQGLPFTSVEFWGTFAIDWLKFGGAAFVVYFTVLKRFMKTPENPLAEAKKVEEAKALLAKKGIRVIA